MTEAVHCDAPPPNECEEDGLRVFEETGSCDGSSGEPLCTYHSTLEPCEHGCAAGACLPNPCESVLCDDPPEPSCDGAELRVFDVEGACDGSSGTARCDYSSSLSPCEFGCEAGACLEDPTMGLGIDIYVDNFCGMTVDPPEINVPAGRTALLTYYNRSADYAVDVWLSYGGGFLDLETRTNWADRFEWCTGSSVYDGYADITTACSSYRLMIHCL